MIPTTAIGTLNWLVTKGHIEFVTFREEKGPRGLNFMGKKLQRYWRIKTEVRKLLEADEKAQVVEKCEVRAWK